MQKRIMETLPIISVAATVKAQDNDQTVSYIVEILALYSYTLINSHFEANRRSERMTDRCWNVNKKKR